MRMRVKLKIVHTLSTILLLFVAVAPVCAYDDIDLDSIRLDLTEVEITKSLFKEMVPVQRLNGENLERLNSNSVADALRYFTGVQLKDYGGIGGIKTIDIRSMGANHVGVFYDGIQLGNAQNGLIDLGMYSLDNIDELAVYNGQKGDIFQSAKDFGSAGTLYIKSRHPKFEDGKSHNLKIKFSTGSFALINPSILLESKISDKVSTSVSAELLNSSGEYKFRYKRLTQGGDVAYDTTAVRENGDIEAIRVEAGVYGDIDDGKWQLKLYTYNSERGIPGAIVNNVWSRGERQWDNNSFIQGGIEKRFTKDYQTKLNTKFAYYNTHYVNNDTNLLSVDNRYKQREFYISSAHNYKILSFWEVSAAYDYQWNDLWSDMANFASPTRNTHMLALATSFEFWRMKLVGSCMGTYINDYTETDNTHNRKQAYSPSVLLSIKPLVSGDLTLRTFVKRSFTMPTFNDLYYTDMGNSSLNPEYATQYDGGVTYHHTWSSGIFRAVRVQSDGYYNRVTDKIVAYPKGQQFRWTMLNLGEVDIKGVDVSAETTIALTNKVFLTVRGQYTFQQAIDVTDPEDSYYGDQIPYVPRHSTSAVGNLFFKGWELNYSFIYAGERYSQQQNIAINYMQPWYTNDVSISKPFNLKKGILKGAIEVNNILNQQYEVIANYPMPGTNFKVTLSYQI